MTRSTSPPARSPFRREPARDSIRCKKIDETLPLDPVSKCMFRFAAGEGAPLHWLHEYGNVTSTRYSGEMCEVEATVPESVKRRLKGYLVG